MLAQRTLDAGRVEGLSIEGYRQLVLLATGSKAAARKAAEARAAAIMRDGRRPE